MANPEANLYELIGGESGVRALIDRFYYIMDTAPEAKELRAIHAQSLKQSREKLFMFLSGWTGGPQPYLEKIGQPALRMRHAPFSIGTLERNQWIWCMHKALDESSIDPCVVEYLKKRFTEVADFLKNRIEL